MKQSLKQSLEYAGLTTLPAAKELPFEGKAIAKVRKRTGEEYAICWFDGKRPYICKDFTIDVVDKFISFHPVKKEKQEENPNEQKIFADMKVSELKSYLDSKGISYSPLEKKPDLIMLCEDSEK
jgi:hypothetical protein